MANLATVHSSQTALFVHNKSTLIVSMIGICCKVLAGLGFTGFTQRIVLNEYQEILKEKEAIAKKIAKYFALYADISTFISNVLPLFTVALSAIFFLQPYDCGWSNCGFKYLRSADRAGFFDW